ncbi:MAG: PilN domain-containing protein [Holophagales bacterium]|jgi:hypothetical protein|nr:PilN domain-containing protein [Holophagales bacterium]
MGVQVIKLNLAPPPTLWRLRHVAIAWIVFAIGTIGLGISVVATLRAYKEADRAGQRTVAITDQARSAQRQQAKVLDELREIKVEQEMPRWRLAERILMERALPWSRITAELERSLVQDVRIKSIQRTRGVDQTVQLKLRGEAKNQGAEALFIESLQGNPAFAQIVLEREAEITNSRDAIEFDYTLLLNTEPPPYELLPKYGPERKASQSGAVSPAQPKAEPQGQKNIERSVTTQATPPPQNPPPPANDTGRNNRPTRRAPTPRQSGGGGRL